MVGELVEEVRPWPSVIHNPQQSHQVTLGAFEVEIWDDATGFNETFNECNNEHSWFILGSYDITKMSKVKNLVHI